MKASSPTCPGYARGPRANLSERSSRGEITWFAGASPYLIEGEVVVDPKATLTIEPGTVIRSKGEGVSVFGKLIARGDQQSMITFEPAAPEKEWKGIVFSGTKNEESAIEFSKITGRGPELPAGPPPRSLPATTCPRIK